jgi:hypothetical protein
LIGAIAHAVVCYRGKWRSQFSNHTWPARDRAWKHTSDLALGHNDHLLGQIFYSLNQDCEWHRQWSQALTQTMIEDTPINREFIQTWINQWCPSALRAVEVVCSLFEEKPWGPGMPLFHDLTSDIVAFSAEYLRTMDLQPSSEPIDASMNGTR